MIARLIYAALSRLIGKRLASVVAANILPLLLALAVLAGAALYLAWDRAADARDAAQARVETLNAQIVQIIAAEALADRTRADLDDARDMIEQLEDGLDAPIDDDLADYIDGLLDIPGVSAPARP
jgi:Tfp pilus assembly protein PilO